MPMDGGLDNQALEGLYQGDYGTSMPHNVGGYLGQNPGANLKPAQTPTGDMRSSPTAWCMGSTDPYRCRSKAAVEHEYCMTKEERYYAGCRAALHQMFFK